MPDTLASCDCCDAMVARDEIADAIEDARRWLDRAGKCERNSMWYRHCMSEAEAAIERAGLIVVGEIGHLFEGGGR